MKKALIIVLAVLTLFTAISCKNEPTKTVDSLAEYRGDVIELNNGISLFNNICDLLNEFMREATVTDLGIATETDLEFVNLFFNGELDVDNLQDFCATYGLSLPEDAHFTSTNLYDFDPVVTATDCDGSIALTLTPGGEVLNINAHLGFTVEYTKTDETRGTKDYSLDIIGDITISQVKTKERLNRFYVTIENASVGETKFKTIIIDQYRGTYLYGDRNILAADVSTDKNWIRYR